MTCVLFHAVISISIRLIDKHLNSILHKISKSSPWLKLRIVSPSGTTSSSLRVQSDVQLGALHSTDITASNTLSNQINIHWAGWGPAYGRFGPYVTCVTRSLDVWLGAEIIVASDMQHNTDEHKDIKSCLGGLRRECMPGANYTRIFAARRETQVKRCIDNIVDTLNLPLKYTVYTICRFECLER